MLTLYLVLSISINLIRDFSEAKPQCPKLGKLENGIVSYLRRNKQGAIVHKTKAIFRCNDGYVLVPYKRTKIKCNRVGKWSLEPPLCFARNITCPPLSMPHGKVSVKPNHVGGIAKFQCGKNYDLMGLTKAMCLPTGNWSVATPKCRLKNCGPPRHLRHFKNGNFSISKDKYALGATITFDCSPNFYMVGIDSLTCVLNFNGKGIWSPLRVPRCYKVRCGYPPPPQHGIRSGSNFLVGGKVRFRCSPGYKLIGSAVRTCKSDGTWSGELAVCDNQKWDCDDPGIPINGRRYGDRFSLGSTVRFECRKGLLVGSSVRTCKTNRTWTGYQPICEDENIVRIPPLFETSEKMKKNFIERVAPATCSSNKDGVCKTFESRGRSISLHNLNGLELVFLLDSSTSIGKQNFETALYFICTLIREFGVDHRSIGGTRVAVVTYSNEAFIAYNLGDFRSNTAAKACDETYRIEYSGGGTGTRYGLQTIYYNVAPNFRERAEKVVLLIADGNSNQGGSPEKWSRKLEDDYGVTIYAIGVGKKIRKKELMSLASEKVQGVFQLNGYDSFKELIANLTRGDYSKCGMGQLPKKNRGRVIGGMDAKDAMFPWQAAIYKIIDGDNYLVDAGAAIIDQKFLLTAAHVFSDEITNIYRVVVGHHRLTRKKKEKTRLWVDKVSYRITKILKHENFNKDTYENDIALLELEKPLKWSRTVRPLCLPTEDHSITNAMTGYVAGWGYTKPDQTGAPEVLQYQSFPVQSNKTCKKAAGKYEFFKEHQFCAGDGQGTKDQCQGDSGGAFVMEMPDDLAEREKSWKAIGIVSWGDGCAKKGNYGYFTRVFPYVNWIKNTMDAAFE